MAGPSTAGLSTRAATLKAPRAAERLCFNDGGSDDGSGSGSDDGSGSGSDDGSGSGSDEWRDEWREIAAEEEELVTGAMGMTAGIFVTVAASGKYANVPTSTEKLIIKVRDLAGSWAVMQQGCWAVMQLGRGPSAAPPYRHAAPPRR
jgi:hypothetical protein